MFGRATVTILKNASCIKAAINTMVFLRNLTGIMGGVQMVQAFGGNSGISK
jgi:hypothetical protein